MSECKFEFAGWGDTDHDWGYKCSVCGEVFLHGGSSWTYCPGCGSVISEVTELDGKGRTVKWARGNKEVNCSMQYEYRSRKGVSDYYGFLCSNCHESFMFGFYGHEWKHCPKCQAKITEVIETDKNGHKYSDHPRGRRGYL